LTPKHKPGPPAPTTSPREGLNVKGKIVTRQRPKLGDKPIQKKTPAPCTSRNESVSGFVQIILLAATRWMLDLMTLRTRLEPVFDYLPVDICEKCFNVFWPFGRFIVEQERVFPYVHHEHRIISGDIADFV